MSWCAAAGAPRRTRRIAPAPCRCTEEAALPRLAAAAGASDVRAKEDEDAEDELAVDDEAMVPLGKINASHVVQRFPMIAYDSE